MRITRLIQLDLVNYCTYNHEQTSQIGFLNDILLSGFRLLSTEFFISSRWEHLHHQAVDHLGN